MTASDSPAPRPLATPPTPPSAPLPRRPESFLASLADNALLAWALRRARRETATLVFAIGFVAVLYGITALLAFVILAPTWRGGGKSELLAAVHVLAWSANAILLLLVVPLRLAQQIAVERERRTIEFLRMTGIPSASLALGAVAAAYSVPLLLSSLSLPLALVGPLSHKFAGPGEAALSYVGLATTSLFYTLIAGTLAFVPKKASQASGAALLGILALAGLGATYGAPYAELCGCFGPWGALMNCWEYSDDRFVVGILGVPCNGLFLQLPFQLAVALVLFQVLSEKLGSDEPFAIGVRGGTLLTCLGALLFGLTFTELSVAHPRPWNKAAGEALGTRYVLLFLALLPTAMDSAVFREALVRGLARPPGRPARANERLRPFRAPLAAAVASAILSVTLLIGISYFSVASNSPFAARGLFLGMASLVMFVAVAASTFQAARLLAPNTAPGALAGLALLVLWLAPLFVTKALQQIDLPTELTSLPLVLSPFSVIYEVSASAVAPPTTITPIQPVAMGMASILVNGLLVAGLQALVQRGVASAEEMARSLVTLPADAFGVAPGQLSRTCPRGHVFEKKWDACPHCK